jgi:hypothetical protein
LILHHSAHRPPAIRWNWLRPRTGCTMARTAVLLCSDKRHFEHDWKG